MEEGPEPHEWVERAAEEHHHGHGGGGGESRSRMMASAITAAVLAVLAAIGSLMSGHAANQAILAQSQATDQWAYFQAKSTKGHLYEVSAEVVQALAGPDLGRVTPSLDRFRDEAKRFDAEKEEVRHKAEHLEAESRHEFEKHHRFAVGIAAFQVGIVLASVSILVGYRPLYLTSLLAGAAGLVMVILGLAT